MVFYGKARWNDQAAEHGAHGDLTPHESPALMVLPLVVLAGLAAVGGVLNLPFNHTTEKLTGWLEPVVEAGERHLASGTEDIKWLLAGIATVGALVGIGFAIAVYAKHKVRAVEPEILAKGWYYDQGITDFMGGPGREAFQGVAWFDANVVDGAVNGSGRGVQGVAGIIRKAQSGFVRSYAALIGLGVVLLLAWFFIRGVAQ
jgi:NADH-quinone oxidoreductase subunit L